MLEVGQESYFSICEMKGNFMFSIYFQTYNGSKEIRTGPEPRVNFIPVNLVTQIRL